MKRVITGLLASALLAQAAAAQEAAVLQSNELKIPGAALIEDYGVAYYSDIRLIRTGPRSFTVVEAHQANLAGIDSVEVLPGNGESVEVVASGTKSTTCVDLLPPVISRDGNTFKVVLAEDLDPAAICIMMLGSHETQFSLDTKDLPPGDYRVEVNQVEAEFSIDP